MTRVGVSEGVLLLPSSLSGKTVEYFLVGQFQRPHEGEDVSVTVREEVPVSPEVGPVPCFVTRFWG